MFKRTARLGIMLMLVVSFMFGSMGVQQAKAVELPLAGIEIMNIEWDGTTDIEGWDFSLATFMIEAVDPFISVGEFKSYLAEELGYPVLILFDTYAEGGGVATMPSDSASMEDYLCTYGYDHFHIFVFIAPATTEEAPIRLTLYGYIDSSENTYVMWSLSGDRNINIKDKIGVDAELVCKLRLVGLELKYDCLEGYDWLGQQIANDPKWINWAHKFASGNGRR